MVLELRPVKSKHEHLRPRFGGSSRRRRLGEKIGLDVGKSANKRERDGARWMEESDPSWVGFGGWLAG